MNQDNFSPFTFFDDGEDQADRWRLDLRETPSAAQTVFDAALVQTNGYTWHAVLDALIRIHHHELLGRLRLSADQNGVVIRSREREVLVSLAKAVRYMLENPLLLRQTLAVADADLLR